MLCHVTRPDSVVMEVEVDAKANGEDCLNKVKTGCTFYSSLCLNVKITSPYVRRWASTARVVRKIFSYVSVNFTSNVSRSFMSRLYVANKTEEPSFCTIRRFYLFLFLELINSPQLHWASALSYNKTVTCFVACSKLGLRKQCSERQVQKKGQLFLLSCPFLLLLLSLFFYFNNTNPLKCHFCQKDTELKHVEKSFVRLLGSCRLPLQAPSLSQRQMALCRLLQVILLPLKMKLSFSHLYPPPPPTQHGHSSNCYFLWLPFPLLIMMLIYLICTERVLSQPPGSLCRLSAAVM